MKIQPATNKLLIQAERPIVGALTTTNREVAIEVAEVLEIGKGVEEYSKGDKIIFKSYGLASVEYNGKFYRFIDVTAGAIQGKIHE
jgi:co-chaperonin GroES (HSP10)